MKTRILFMALAVLTMVANVFATDNGIGTVNLTDNGIGTFTNGIGTFVSAVVAAINGIGT